MPAFAKILKPEEIEAVAAYVLDRAEHNWSRG
jgi:cytochrome c6